MADPAFDGTLASLSLAPTPTAIGLVLDLTRDGRIPVSATREWLVEAKTVSMAAWTHEAPRRSAEEVTRILDSQGTDRPGQDRLDVLFGFFGPDVSADLRERFFRGWRHFSASQPPAYGRRMSAALVCAHHEHWTSEALALAGYAAPLLFAWPAIPLATRRAAAEATYGFAKPYHMLPSLYIRRMLESPLVTRGGGTLDLSMAGALSRFQSEKPPYELLVEVLGQDSIVQAFLRDPLEHAPFLSIGDKNPRGRRWMIDRILDAAGEDRARVHAIAATSGQPADLAFLAGAPPALRLKVVEHLLDLERRPGLAFEGAHAETLAKLIVDGTGTEKELLARWLSRPDWERSSLGPALLVRAGRMFDHPVLATALASLETKLLRRLLAVLEARHELLGFPHLHALAEELADHTSPAIASWAEAHGRPPPTPVAASFLLSAETRPMPDDVADAIATDPDPTVAVRRAASRPWTGLVEALRRRRSLPAPNVEVAAALLGSHDDPMAVAEELERWIEPRPAFLEALDAYAVKVGSRHPAPPLLLQSWLWRFERFGLDAGRKLIEAPEGLASSLRFASRLPSALVAEHVWAAAARTLAVWWRREPERLTLVGPFVDEVLDLAIELLDHAEGLQAARIIRVVHDARLAPAAIGARLARLRERMPDVADEARRELRELVSTEGLASRARGAHADDGHASEDVLAEIRTSSDLEALARRCHDDVLAIVHEAALRLVGLGEEGQRRLAWLLAGEMLPLHFDAITASLPLWSEGDALDAVRFGLTRGHGHPELRFRVAIALSERGEDRIEAAIEAVLAPSAERWLRVSDAEKLAAGGADPRALFRRLATSPHAPAYRKAVLTLLEGERDAEDRAALRAFLELGSERIADLRRAVAVALAEDGDRIGLPILANAMFTGLGDDTVLWDEADEGLVLAIVESFLVLGDHPEETKLVEQLRGVDAEVRERCLERLLAESQQIGTRSKAVSDLPRRPTRSRKLRALAEIFAWGAAVSRHLTGGVLRPHLISGEGLGYTRLNENRVFVSPLPLLRGDRNGREIVEGLVLHEIGHHRHHKGREASVIWAKADSVGLGQLLNLVADEHLERNLRAFDEGFGHRLKRLGAYAFQHADRDVMVDVLLKALGGRAFDVLTACAIDAARNPFAIRIQTGSVLRELEHHGSSFARFARALRMGLGDRHEDPKVREGLALFDRGFKRLEMRGLWRVTKEVHRIFGEEVQLAFAFGGAESLEDDPWGRTTHGEEIGDDDVQQEVERILGAPDQSGDARPTRRGRLAINVGGGEGFDLIHDVKKVAPSPARHREVAAKVSRHARRLRQYLVQLGLSYDDARMRLRGRRLDRTRLRPLVVRGDPRVLVARELHLDNDLFLGLIVDCSGSMAGTSMERAHAFGVLLTEAVRGMRGVDLRIFGFTDREIFDAGDARRPAVTSLVATAGNNDAAGLYHVAQVALRSPRKARVLVMISDGLPTECSVDALRGLVRTLTQRHKLVCAQVAVRPLEEVCFPHYVEVTEDNLDGAVARFGQIVARLVGRTLRDG
ncbi:MAG: VWA domain-containing protein [Myxococcales bacterium]|nr:VWA domain-containing protein [Myxococcales bacterium]